jgi:hypothetical protein
VLIWYIQNVLNRSYSRAPKEYSVDKKEGDRELDRKRERKMKHGKNSSKMVGGYVFAGCSSDLQEGDGRPFITARWLTEELMVDLRETD